MSLSKGKRGPFFALVVVFSLAVLVGTIAIHVLLQEKKSWSVSTRIEDSPVTVEMTWTYRRGVFQMGHQSLIPGGDDKYMVTVNFLDGRSLKFVAASEPRAIWKVDQEFYTACYSPGGRWFIARVTSDGHILPISRKELPSEQIDWNLVDQSDKEDWQKSFDLWAE